MTLFFVKPIVHGDEEAKEWVPTNCYVIRLADCQTSREIKSTWDGEDHRV